VRIVVALVLSAVVTATALVSTQSKAVRVLVQTELGDIVIEVDPVKAPITTANFLKYVDGGHYDGGIFHRTVKLDNQPESTVKIEVIQAGVNPDRAKDGFAAIPLERTNVTGILHKDGVVSMARGAPDSATSGWFVCINDQPSLDFGGNRNPDGQGFAAFGRVVTGMEVVRKIQAAPSSTNRTTNTEAQRLTPAIKILKAARLPQTGA
jgi:peptidyl-prolyl cis-trans isomerase A (cyclophilin A)